METCRRMMTHKTILLAMVILVFIEKSDGYFLENVLLSETSTEEPEISTTLRSSTLTSTETNQLKFDEIHRNVSENIEGSSTQIVNSVKDIVGLVLEEHLTDTEAKAQQNVTEENNQIDDESKKIAPDSKNDIPVSKAFATKLDHDSNDSLLSIVKIPEADNKDLATALEDNIRSSVKDEIQLEQNFESSAIDVIDDIPDPEVRQTLTEDLMAIEYPQSVKKLEVPDTVLVKNEDDKIDSTEVLIDVTTEAIISEKELTSTNTVPLNDEILDEGDDAASTKATTITETIPDIEVTTSTTDIVQEIAMIPSEEIVHSLEELHATENMHLHYETKSIRTRQMRGFHEDSETNEVLQESSESSEDKESAKSESSESVNSSKSSGSSSNMSSENKSSTKDENVAAEDTSEEDDLVISKDASIEESLEKENNTVKPVITTEAAPENKVTGKSIATIKVTPTPRPSIGTTTEVPSKDTTKTDSIASIEEIDGTTESTGEILNEVAVTIGDGKHIVFKKPGVDEEPMVLSGRSDIEARPDEDSVVSQDDSKVADTDLPATPSAKSIIEAGDQKLVTEKNLLGKDENKTLETLTTVRTPVSPNLLHDEIVPSDYSELKKVFDTAGNKSSKNATTEVAPDTQVAEDTDVPKSSKTLSLESLPPLNEMHEETSTETSVHKENIEPSVPLKNINQESVSAGDLEKNASTILIGAHGKNPEQAGVPKTVTVGSELHKENVEPSVPLKNIDQDSMSTGVLEKTASTTLIGVHGKNPEQPGAPETVTVGTERNSTLENNDDAAKKDEKIFTPIETTDEHKANEDSNLKVPQSDQKNDIIQTHQLVLSSSENKTRENLTTDLAPVSPKHPQTYGYKENVETSVPLEYIDKTIQSPFSNEISKHVGEQEHTPTSEIPEDELQTQHMHSITYETTTEKPIAVSPALVDTPITTAELTTFTALKDETVAISDEIVSPAAVGQTFNTIAAEGLGKPLPTRSVGEEPSSSSYSSEDKTTTVVVLCSAAAIMFIAFSVAIYLITFQRQHGTLDIEMQEQRCGKGEPEDDEDAETRVYLLNQPPPIDSDDHSFD